MSIRRGFKKAGGWIALSLIGGYQVSRIFFLPPACRFYPNCSTYAADAVRKYGPAQGSWKALRRLCRCHPFHPGGYDPA